jgi:hypothetical protein
MKKASQRTRQVTLTPKEFLYHVEFGMDRTLSNRGVQVVVKGDLAVEDNDGLLVIPEATILGDVRINRCVELEACRLRVSGSLVISECPSLKSLKGSASQVVLTRVAVGAIGADFETTGNLLISNCQNLKRLNCQVGGSLRIEGSGSVEVGPAFSVAVHTSVPGGLALSSRRTPPSHSSNNSLARSH